MDASGIAWGDQHRPIAVPLERHALAGEKPGRNGRIGYPDLEHRELRLSGCGRQLEARMQEGRVRRCCQHDWAAAGLHRLQPIGAGEGSTAEDPLDEGGKRRQVLGEDGEPGDPDSSVRVPQPGRLAHRLWGQMLAGEEVEAGALGRIEHNIGEAKLERRCLALEEPPELADPGRAEPGGPPGGRCGGGVVTGKGDAQQPLADCRQEAVEAVAERRRVDNAQKLEVVALEHDAVVGGGPADMPAARGRVEAEPGPLLTGGRQILDPDDQVVEAANGALHGCFPSITATGIADEGRADSQNGGSTMTIGIICAIPQELGHLADAMDRVATETHGGLGFQRGPLDGHDVVLAGGGVGKVNAALTATLLADRFACRCLVFSGVAGGLDPALHVGDVVIGAHTLQHDAGVLQAGRIHTYQAGHVPFFNPTDQLGYRPPAELLARIERQLDGFTLPPLSAAAAGGQARTPVIGMGTILTGDQFLNCAETRERLFKELGGQAIEMEGGAVGQVAQAFGIPHLVIRALSDLAGAESHVDFGRFVAEVAAGSAAIVRRLLAVL